MARRFDSHLAQRLTRIFSPARPRYPDGMFATDPATPERRRFAIGLPRLLWIGVAAVVLVVVALGLRIGLPIYRHQAAIHTIERIGYLNERFGIGNFEDGDFCRRALGPMIAPSLPPIRTIDEDLAHGLRIGRHLAVRARHLPSAKLKSRR